MSFGWNEERQKRAPKSKKPKPKRGRAPTTLEQCTIGSDVVVKLRFYRWSKGKCHVRCVGPDGTESEPEIVAGDWAVHVG